VVACHVDPDGDALGSMIAMAMVMEKLKVKATMYSKDGVPRVYKFLPWSDKIVNRVPAKEYDLLITVDSSDLKRIGDKKIKAKKIINIDHHVDNTNFGDINFVESLSSVGEMVYKLALDYQVGIDKDMADALYVSIITDTGNFKYSNTLPSTFEVARDLVVCGANPSVLATKSYDTKSFEGLKALAKALSKAQISKNRKVIWSSLSLNEAKMVGAKQGDLVGIIDHLRTFWEAEVAVFFREEKPGLIKANFRSKGQANVSLIAKKFGGGGHPQASGVVVEGDLEETVNKIIEAVVEAVK